MENKEIKFIEYLTKTDVYKALISLLPDDITEEDINDDVHLHIAYTPKRKIRKYPDGSIGLASGDE
jgi:hypothetical protein